MAEDLDPLVTQCPNCDTRFRVNETQLQAASGQVRCGACLSVFDGTAHLHLDGEPLSTMDGAADVDALLTEIDAQEAGLGSEDAAVGFAPAPSIDVPDPEIVERVEAGELELEELEAELLAELKSADQGVNPSKDPLLPLGDVVAMEVDASEVAASELDVPDSTVTIGTPDPDVSEKDVSEIDAPELDVSEIDPPQIDAPDIDTRSSPPEVGQGGAYRSRSG